MSEWLKEVYIKRPDGFFHKFLSLVICDSMRAISPILSKLKLSKLICCLQSFYIGVNRLLKVKLQAACTLKMQIWVATNNRDMPRVMKTKFPATVMVFGVCDKVELFNV